MKPNRDDPHTTDHRGRADTAGVIDEVQAISSQWQADHSCGSLRVADLYDEVSGLPR